MARMTLAAAAAALVAVALGTADAAGPRCYGAPSRDPVHRCDNPRLRHMVSPTPSHALMIPSEPCSPLKPPIACAFGPPASDAGWTVALVGDSHAGHWRAPLKRVADALGWPAVSLTHSSCQLSRAVPVAPRWKQDDCSNWNRDATQWLTDHPEVSTIVTSNHPGRVKTAPGQSQGEARVEGIRSALNALPSSVKHIIVIRDVPVISLSTMTCVERATRRHVNVGRTCAFKRRTALHRDDYVVVARRLNSPRMQVVDLTHFFCGPRLCYPVVGGALVYKDYLAHVTRSYANTLAPYLLERIERLMASWS